MSLAPATRLGPYEIVAAIGAGGMGEVYRARDTRLAREVAIKVMASAPSGDADRMRRFKQEALAAARLSHPHILQVFDIGRHEGRPYLVTELLEGQTLRQRLDAGPIPPQRSIEIAIAIASGLGAAHDQGIVHRDLKPENLFVTDDGRVKILDFGLAKLLDPDRPDPARNDGQTVEAGTSAGVIVGTAGYMSPEQVRGQDVDARSDLFSFGAILHEMLSGRRAFHGETPVETMSAILREDPADLTALDPKIPPLLQLVVRHCLEKSPGGRFRSAYDLAFQLQAISGASSSALAAEVAPSGRLAPRFRSVTHRRGMIYAARFAPDGTTILYSAAWDGGAQQVFLWRPESPEAIALPLPTAQLLAVSHGGEMALGLEPRWVHNGSWAGTLATAPLFGGVPRQLEHGVEWADFDPRGSGMLVVHEHEGLGTLEAPLGHVLLHSSGHLSHPRWSPSGESIAFLEHPIALDDRGSVALVDREGNRRTLTDVYHSIQGLAWAPGGEEIWFTAATADAERSQRRSLFAVDLDGRSRLVSGFPGSVRLFDIAPDGRVLMARDDDRIGTWGKPPGDAPERELSWLDWSIPKGLSADGRWLLFEEDRAGMDYIVCLRGSDGTPAVRLGQGTARAISGDGRWVLAQKPNPGAPLELLPTGAGRGREIPVGDLEIGATAWLPDGQRVFCVARGADAVTRAGVLDLRDARFVPLGPEFSDRAHGAAVTSDGTRAAISFTGGRSVLVTLDGGALEEGPQLDPDDSIVAFDAAGGALLVEKWGSRVLRIDRIRLADGRREPWKELSPGDPTGLVLLFYAHVALDGDAYAYAVYRILSDLYVVEGLR